MDLDLLRPHERAQLRAHLAEVGEGLDGAAVDPPAPVDASRDDVLRGRGRPRVVTVLDLAPDLQPRERARLERLLVVLSDGKLWSSPELQDVLQCSRRTISKFMPLLELAGFPVEPDHIGRWQGYQLVNPGAARRFIARKRAAVA